MKITIYEPQYNVSLEIQCVENWIFSQYDVKVYLNDNYEGTITHGGTETYSAVLNKGKHTIKFVSAEDDTLTGNVKRTEKIFFFQSVFIIPLPFYQIIFSSSFSFK